MKERGVMKYAVSWKTKGTIQKVRVGCESATQEGKRYPHNNRQHGYGLLRLK